MKPGLPLIPSYGRRRGRKLRAARRGLLEALLPKLTIALPAGDASLELTELLGAKKEYWLEIGFGRGEHLAAQAARHSNIGFIGCEPYVDGIGSLLKAVDAQRLRNTRIFPDDARRLITRLPDACLSRVFVLFPDPWPKARHHKRRLINTAFLADLARVMRLGGELWLATDDSCYAEWMLLHALAVPEFAWLARGPEDWAQPPEEWVQTRYEQKARAKGASPAYFRLQRR